MENNDRFKFRCWEKRIKEFIYEGSINIKTGAFATGNLLDEKYLIKEQCTGLKDKNGNLIYEGDILKDKYGVLHPISWNIKGFYQADTFAVAGFYKAIQEEMEVIGNIHENPELLEE